MTSLRYKPSSVQRKRADKPTSATGSKAASHLSKHDSKLSDLTRVKESSSFRRKHEGPDYFEGQSGAGEDEGLAFDRLKEVRELLGKRRRPHAKADTELIGEDVIKGKIYGKKKKKSVATPEEPKETVGKADTGRSRPATVPGESTALRLTRLGLAGQRGATGGGGYVGPVKSAQDPRRLSVTAAPRSIPGHGQKMQKKTLPPLRQL